MKNIKKSKNQAKVLIVDDERIILEMYAVKLKKFGYQVFTAELAINGLEIVEKEKPDVVLVDIVMPTKDGFWLLESIKKHQDKSISQIPVIMLTNLDDSDSRLKCCQLGCLYYLVKPQHTPLQLSQLIKDVVSVKKSLPEVLVQATKKIEKIGLWQKV